VPSGNLLVAQGGGPTAVVNCSLVGVIEEAKRAGVTKINKIIGALNGVDGIIDEVLIDLRKELPSTLRKIYHMPGAALGSCRRTMAEEDYGRIVDVFSKYNVRYFFYIGGNGSMHTANKVAQAARDLGYSLAVIGVPKTIDNDIPHTDHSPGYGSAARYFATVTKEIGLDVESLPPPISVIETLGRNTGWLAAATSLAREQEEDAPNLIYVPERNLNIDKFLSDVSNVYDKLGRAVVVVSEGLKDEQGNYLGGIKTEASKDGFGRGLPGGAASYLAELISEKLGIRARSEKPGLAARTGIEYVSSTDQREAYLVGKMAVRFALEGKTGVMMTLVREDRKDYRCTVGYVPLEAVSAQERLLPNEYLNKNGNDVSGSFIRYCLPIIGGQVRSFASLARHKLIKRGKSLSTGKSLHTNF